MRLLEMRGHLVVSANNGVEALAVLRRERFDLALMDIQMPEMDGLEATSRIRQIEKETGDHLPIIALTAHAVVEYRAKCMEVGMDGYLTKPINVEALFRTIGGLMRIPSGAPQSPIPLSG